MTTSMRTISLLLLGGLLLSVAQEPARAQESRSDEHRACAHDVSRHCRKQINDGDMAIFQCLQQNRERLSPLCRKVVDSH